MKTHPMPARIIETLQHGPMTIRQIASSLSTSEDRIRMSMQRMEASGRICRAGFGTRTKPMGCTPYLWRAV